MSDVEYHVALGEGGGHALARATQVPNLYITQDLFTEGPCCDPELPPQQWLEQRLSWWSRRPGSEEGIARGRHAISQFQSLQSAATAITIWCADAASEELHLSWLCAVLPEQTSVRVARNRRESAPFCGVGHLSDEEINSVEIRTLTGDERRGLSDGWRAYCGTSLAGANAVNDFTPGIAELYRCRIPDAESGLTYWELMLLRLVAHHPEDSRSVLRSALSRRDVRDFPGDQALWDWLLELSSAGLLVQAGDGENFETTGFKIAPAGESTLHGASALGRLREERWLGGTQLRSAHGAWSRRADGAVGYAPFSS